MIGRVLAGLAGTAAALALAACGGEDTSARNLDSLDNALVDSNAASPSADPALTGALADQIMVDPQLVGQANGDAIRPPGQPYAAPVAPDIRLPAGAPGAPAKPAEQLRHAPDPAAAGCPQCDVARRALTLGALAAGQPNRSISACGPRLRYSAAWAQRLPAELPLYPDAQVEEAAGTDDNRCGVRVISFSSAAEPGTVVDFYFTHSAGGGFTAQTQADGEQRVIGGTRGRDGRAFIVYVSARAGGGSSVDLVTNAGG